MLRYAITSGEATPRPLDAESGRPGYLPLLEQVKRLAAARVEYIQLREKHLPAGELAILARAILALLEDSQTRLLINTRTDVALATGAHGVHLTPASGEQTPAQIRSLYRSIGLPGPTISKACHTLSQVRTAAAQQPDLILFSPVFGKAGTPATGLEALTQVCKLAHPIPVLALGSVTQANTPECLAAGAAGVAGIRLFT